MQDRGSEATKPIAADESGKELATIFRVAEPIRLSGGRLYAMRKLKMREILTQTPLLTEAVKSIPWDKIGVDKAKPADTVGVGYAFAIEMARVSWPMLAAVLADICRDITDGMPGQVVRTQTVADMDMDDALKLLNAFLDRHEGVIDTFFGLMDKAVGTKALAAK